MLSQVDPGDYRFILTGGVSLDEPPAKPAPWIPERAWSELFKLGKLTHTDLYKDFHVKVKKRNLVSSLCNLFFLVIFPVCDLIS